MSDPNDNSIPVLHEILMPGRAPRPHEAPAVQPASESAAPGVFDRVEPLPPAEAGATVPPDLGHEAAAQSSQPDADLIAERLRGRFAGFLSGEGRSVIEARCRDALQQHASLLVTQITREVARTLEAEMTGWVREAVQEELARRSGRA